MSGFPRRLENLENENGHGKVMEHKTLVKGVEFCYQSWNFTRNWRRKTAFSDVSAKPANAKSMIKMVMEKLWTYLFKSWNPEW